MKPLHRLPPPPLFYRLMQAVAWPMLKLLGSTCEHAFHLSADRMDRKLTRSEALRLRAHLLMCGVCRRLPAQFRRMRELVRCATGQEHEETTDAILSPEVKARIAARLQKESGP